MKKISLANNCLMKFRPKSNQSVKYPKFGVKMKKMSREDSFWMEFRQKKVEKKEKKVEKKTIFSVANSF